MSKRPVVEIKCGRCDRKEYREPSQEEPAFQGDPALSAVLTDEIGVSTNVRFDDLCTPCINTIKGHIAQIGKKIEGVSPVREKKGNGAKILEALEHKKTEQREEDAMKKGHAKSA